MSDLPLGEIKRRVFAAMAQAYAEASDDGRLPALARQIGYAVRRLSGLGDRLKMDYFLKQLLDKYLDAHPEETADWDVVRDDRGTFIEPHTYREVPLGTLDVRRYLNRRDPAVTQVTAPQFSLDFPTHGPRYRFGSILYVEKSGFEELLNAEGIAERWDIGIIEGKGYSVRAARALLRTLRTRHPDLKVLVAHDFDKAGIGIYDTLGVGFTDIGLRLTDVLDEDGEPRWGLDPASDFESVSYKAADPRPNLALRGASAEEIAFLCHTTSEPFAGRRVELNALTGRRLIDYLEAKFAEHGLRKVIPDSVTLDTAYRRAHELALINRAIDEAFAQARADAQTIDIPGDLVTQVTDALEDDPGQPWDDAVAAIVRGRLAGEAA